MILLTVAVAVGSLLAGPSALALTATDTSTHPTVRPTKTTPSTDVASLDGQIAALKRQIEAQLKDLDELQKEAHSGGTVDLATMSQLQFRMQLMSQYIEATSNALSAVHQSMMTIARAIKGQ